MAVASEQFVPALHHGLITQGEHQKMVDKAHDDEHELVAYLKHLCHQNHLLFAHYFLGLDIPPFSRDVFRKIEGKNRNLVLISRDHSKTYIFTYARSCHDICYGFDPEFPEEDPRCMILRESEDDAAEDVGVIQTWLKEGGGEAPYDYINHPAGFRDHEVQKSKDGHGRTIHEASEVWNALNIQLPGSTSRDKTLVGGGIRGETGKHPYLLIADDLVTEDNSRTPGQKKTLRRRWGRKVEQGILGVETEAFILGTKYYFNELYDHLEADEKWNTVKVPALNRMPEEGDWEPVYDDGDRVNVKLTPQGLGQEALKPLQAIWPCPLGPGNCPGPRGGHFEKYGVHRSVQYLIHDKYLANRADFMSQQMLQVIADDETRIKPEMLRFWSTDKAKVGQRPNQHNDTRIVGWPDPEDIIEVVHGWDHAISKKSYADNTACARLYRTRDNKVFVRMEARKMGYVEAVDLMESYFEEEPRGPWCNIRPSFIATESSGGFQQAYKQQLASSSGRLLASVLEEVQRGNRDKDQFLNKSGLLQAMRNGTIYIEYEDENFIDELLYFTPEGGSYHDDRLDALANGYYIINQRVRRPARSWDLGVDDDPWNQIPT